MDKSQAASACDRLLTEYTAIVVQLERAQAVVRRIERERARLRVEILKAAHGSQWEVSVHLHETAPAPVGPAAPGPPA